MYVTGGVFEYGMSVMEDRSIGMRQSRVAGMMSKPQSRVAATSARVLDLCCGMGGLSVAAREMGMRAVAGGGAPHNATGSTEHGKAPAT